MSYRAFGLGALLAAAMLQGGCSLVVGGIVDDLNVDATTMRVEIRAFQPHVNQTTIVELLNDSNFIVAQVQIQPTPSPCLDIELVRAASVGGQRLDFWADLNGNGELDPAPADHSWSEMLAEDGSLEFVHNTDFADLTDEEEFERNLAGDNFEVSLSQADVVDNQPTTIVYINLTEDADGNPVEEEVGVLHLAQGPQTGNLFGRLTGVVDGGTNYIVELSFGDGLMRTRCTTEPVIAPNAGGIARVLVFDELGCEEVPAEETRQAFTDCAVR